MGQCPSFYDDAHTTATGMMWGKLYANKAIGQLSFFLNFQFISRL